MPSGIKGQITKDQLIEQLEQMKEGETIEILTGDLIEKHGQEYTLNSDSDNKFFNMEDLVDMIYCANRIYFIDVPEESFIEGFDLGLQTGGGIINDVITLKNGKLLVITEDSISIYASAEDYEIGFDLGTYTFCRY